MTMAGRTRTDNELQTTIAVRQPGGNGFCRAMKVFCEEAYAKTAQAPPLNRLHPALLKVPVIEHVQRAIEEKLEILRLESRSERRSPRHCRLADKIRTTEGDRIEFELPRDDVH
jgi:hypothetical protein